MHGAHKYIDCLFSNCRAVSFDTVVRGPSCTSLTQLIIRLHRGPSLSEASSDNVDVNTADRRMEDPHKKRKKDLLSI